MQMTTSEKSSNTNMTGKSQQKDTISLDIYMYICMYVFGSSVALFCF